MLTGVGGQGVQLGAQVLARAAILEDRHVMVLGTYGGTMRGGNTDSTVVIADGPISAPPILSHVGVALAMHHAFWKPVRKKLRPGALVLLNSTVFEGDAEIPEDARLFEVPATRIASDLGNGLGASMVFIAAYARLTGLLRLESLIEAMRQSIPAYRKENIAKNEETLRAGFEALPANEVPAWALEGDS